MTAETQQAESSG